jgi:hypothetical protein
LRQATAQTFTAQSGGEDLQLPILSSLVIERILPPPPPPPPPPPGTAPQSARRQPSPPSPRRSQNRKPKTPLRYSRRSVLRPHIVGTRRPCPLSRCCVTCAAGEAFTVNVEQWAASAVETVEGAADGCDEARAGMQRLPAAQQ